jgi:thioredoxin 2
MERPSPSVITVCPACSKRNRVPSVAQGVPQCGACKHALPWVVEAGGADFGVLTAGSTPVLVDLWAPWCGPCRTVGPLIEALAVELAGALKVVKVNVDLAPGVSQHFTVQGIPTLLLLRDGREVARQVGALPAHALRSWVTSELAKVRA